MTLGDLPALGVLALALVIFFRAGCVRGSSPARGHGAGSQGDGTGAPDRPGTCRPEFYEQCAIGSDGKCTRWSHYHYPEVKS